MAERPQQIITAREERNVEFVPFGASDKIKLNIAIVRSLVAVPTKSGKLPSDQDCMKFIMLCQARHLNPFDGDAFLLGYDDQNKGPTFSLITAHQVFLKRAEAGEKFDGMESGVIVIEKKDYEDDKDSIIERQGDLLLNGEVLVGGWAKVYRRDRSKPMYRRLNLSTFSTGRSRWGKDPAGMIVKCAEADALRSTFPSHLGGLYLTEERPEIDLVPVPQIPKGRVGNAAPAEMLKDAAEVIVSPVEQQQPEEQPVASETEKPKRKKSEEKTDAEETNTPPSADMLRADLLKLARVAAIGKGMVVSYFGGDEKFNALAASELQDAIDNWDDTKVSILEQ